MKNFATLMSVACIAGALSTAAFAQQTNLSIGMVLEPPHLDPTAGAAAAIDEVVYANIFEGLTRITEDGTVRPALAENWVVSADGLTYTFDLRSGVTFHDGTTFEASDVVFSLERLLADDSLNAQKALFSSIDKVTALEELSVQIDLKQPDGALLYNLGWGDAVIVAPESAATNKEAPVGTGPFRFTNWTKGSSIQLDANGNYWGEAPKLERVVFRFISDAAAATAALLSGDVQAFPNMPAPESMGIFEADSRFVAHVGTTEGETILAMNNAKPPFDNVKVRQAISHAINRQSIIDGAMFGYGTPIGSHFAPHHPAYVELVETYVYDPSAAKALLAEAGYENGFKATLKLPPPTYSRRGGEIIAAQLREIGIDLEIIPVEWPVWLEQVFTNKDYDLTVISHTEPNDIGIYARDGYYFQYSNPDFKALIDELNKTSDEDTRFVLYRKAQEMLAADAVNAFLFQLPKLGVWDRKLKGMWLNSPVQANDLSKVFWEN